MSFFFSILLTLGLSNFALAETDDTNIRASETKFINTGHNVTQTAYVFPARRCTIGTLLVACGLTDRITVGTSPWLLSSYNMYNLSVRYGLERTDKRETALQFGYFSTYGTKVFPEEANVQSPSYQPFYCSTNYPACRVGYDMQAAWFYYIRSHHLAPHYTLHWNLDVAYYWRDKRPFSIRRPQSWQSPWQVNAMTLHEVHLVKNFYMQGELGILGASEKFPAAHAGATLDYRGHNWAVEFGMSATGSIAAWLRTDRQDYHSASLQEYNGIDRQFSDLELERDFAIHPEVLVQFSFDI